MFSAWDVVLSYAVSSAGFCHAPTTSRNTFHSPWLIAQVSAYFLLAEASQTPAGWLSVSFGLQQSPTLPHHSPGHLITVRRRHWTMHFERTERGCPGATRSSRCLHSRSSINVGWVCGWMHPNSPVTAQRTPWGQGTGLCLQSPPQARIQQVRSTCLSKRLITKHLLCAMPRTSF